MSAPRATQRAAMQRAMDVLVQSIPLLPGVNDPGLLVVKQDALRAIDELRDALAQTAEQAGPVPSIVADVLAELAKAVAKFPTWPTDPLHALAVLGEEFGELTKDVLQLCYEPHKTTPESARKEAMQTAAMALRFAMSLARYEYRPGPQHAQGEAR